uniref:Ig-like domain-containing protein n=1 Tax=Cyclopterus lumpus TaxID=8103 RepID=A0A8C2X4W9_CYCLU
MTWPRLLHAAVTLEVIYPQRSITAAGGSSVKLSCDAVYDVERCDALHAAWYRTGPDAQLTDPGRYFTTVNETDGRGRRRQVVTEIRDLKAEDGGLFQCKAECEAGDKAMGHYITITVEVGSAHKGLNSSNKAPIYKSISTQTSFFGYFK